MYNQKSARVRQKDAAPVTIRTVGEDAFDGEVYVAIGHRLVDLLNDERAFIPVRREDGDTMILAKSQIVSIVEHAAVNENAANGREDDVEAGAKEEIRKQAASTEKANGRKFDPYALLKIDRTASIDEIRAAYKSRIKMVHPDSVAALGLDDDLADAALRATQKLNYAYQKIIRDREGAAAEERASA